MVSQLSNLFARTSSQFYNDFRLLCQCFIWFVNCFLHVYIVLYIGFQMCLMFCLWCFLNVYNVLDVVFDMYYFLFWFLFFFMRLCCFLYVDIVSLFCFFHVYIRVYVVFCIFIMFLCGGLNCIVFVLLS